MQLTPNGYLQTNLNRMESGPGSLLKAQNIRIDGKRLRQRKGQDLLIPEDPFGISTVSGYAGFRCRKLFFYNNRVWGYFTDTVDTNNDVIGYFQPSIGSGQWILHQLTDYEQGFNIDADQLPPQFIESNKRLLFASELGVYCSPKLEQDPVLGTSLSSIQTILRPAGCPPALPLRDVNTVDTTSTYDSNWLELGSAVAYRHVWKYIDANGTAVYGAVSDIHRVNATSGAFVAVQMEIVIPLEIFNSDDVSRFSCEIYRTLSSIPSVNFSTPDPGDEMYLVQELRPAAADKSAGVMAFTDIIAPQALQGPLYTNQTQQGANASRVRPPRCKTVQDFSGCAWFGNVIDRWTLPFELTGVVDPSATTPQGLSDNDIIVIAERCYQGKTGALGIADNEFSIDTSASFTNQFTRIRNTVNNLQEKYNFNFTRALFDLNTDTGPDDIAGRMILQQASNHVVQDSFTPYIGLYRQAGWPSSGSSNPSPLIPTPLVTETKGKAFKIVKIVGSGSSIIFTLDSVPDFVAGDTVNVARANVYSDMSQAAGSQGDGTLNFNPGQYRVAVVAGNTVTLAGVSGTIITQEIGVAPFATVWTNLGAMHCVMDSITGLKSAAIGEQKASPGRVMYSPYYEPQSAPSHNYIEVGATDKRIIKLSKLNKSLFVFKQDGLYRVSGYFPNFSVEQFDPNIILVGPDCVASMGGALYCLTTKGVYIISENDSRRISYDVQNDFDILVARSRIGIQLYGFAVGNEVDNSVTFWFDHNPSRPEERGVPVAYIYDGQGWTKRTDQANGACCGINDQDPDDNYSLYVMKNAGSGWLTKQRKVMTGLDYSDESIPVPAPTVLTPSSVEITTTNDAGVVTTSNFLPGSVLVCNGEFAKRAVITSVLDLGSNVFRCSLEFIDSQYTTASLTGTGVVYFPIYSEWQYSIQGSDQIDIRKHFSDVGIVFQQPYFSKADIGFASDVDPSQTWLVSNLKGFISLRSDPNSWPLLQDDDLLADKTQKALVSTGKQRCSQLRVSIRHRRAMEFISVYGHYVTSNDGGKNIERNNG